ncbi:DUF58 domain-containing protein [Schlesneria paludicola]|uniref:DUF58 domain-containing protein n=1 Tax=Schlesneria paludicola TaxID=360056 RepID=UPI00029B4A54|nr:DUF58 domain-containing protein [Schlesneria paludicola]
MDQYIDPATLMQLRSLELRARHVVQGFMTGLNRSPYHGFSVEFTEYRQYSQGDDPRHLDWRLFARTDRYYIKRFEDETNLRCLLLLDASRSMNFGSMGYTKSEYARTLAATLAYFLSTQRDAVGLATFSENIDDFIPPRYRSGHLRRLMVSLEKVADGTSTHLAGPLIQIAERLNKRGMLVLISDLLAPIETLEQSLGSLTVRGQDVIVFHVLDPAELQFQFDTPEMFVDLETNRRLYVDPAAVRREYLERFSEHLAAIESICARLGLVYHRLATDTPLETSLPEVIRLRMQTRGNSRTRISRR